MSPDQAGARRPRAAAHACPECLQPWAVRGMRTSSGSWLFSCRFCAWHDIRSGAAAAGPAGGQVRGTTGGSPAPRAHAMRLYDGNSELVRSVAAYLAQGWAEGGVGIVIATAEHRAMLGDLLDAQRLTPCIGEGQLIQLDARDTLRLFMQDGLPDTLLFQQTVGELLRQHSAGPPVRAFGDMVDLLWADGNVAGALRLEQLWNRLQQEVAFTLLCSYASDQVDADGRAALSQLHDSVAC